MEPKIQDKEIRMVRGQKVQVKVWENYGKKRYYFEVLGERGAGASSQDVQMAYDCGRKEFCDCKNNLLKSKRLNLICKAAWEQEMIQVWGL